VAGAAAELGLGVDVAAWATVGAGVERATGVRVGSAARSGPARAMSTAEPITISTPDRISGNGSDLPGPRL
jgi:hypothetical protein